MSCPHNPRAAAPCADCSGGLRDSVPDEVLEPLPPPMPVADHTICGQAILAAVLAERARCRAVVMRLFGDDWRGNEALAAIGGEG